MALSVGLILGGLILVAVGLSPRILRALAAHLIAWSEGVEAFKRIRMSGLKFWREKLEVARG